MSKKSAMSEEIAIASRDFWVKVVGMLQQNWALIEPEQDAVRIHFIFQEQRFDFGQLDTYRRQGNGWIGTDGVSFPCRRSGT